MVPALLIDEMKNSTKVLLLSSLSQETALECHFGTDRTFEARWVNSSAVECVHVLVSQGCGRHPISPAAVTPYPPRSGEVLPPNSHPQLDAASPSPYLHFQVK